MGTATTSAIIRLTKPVSYGGWNYPAGTTLAAHRHDGGTFLFTDRVGIAYRLDDDEFEVVEGG